MRDKYANKTPIKRFFHKYTGFIVCGVLLTVGLLIFNSMMGEQFFFEKWDCGSIQRYVFSGQDFGFPRHGELTEDEHVRLHEIMDECGLTDRQDGLFSHQPKP